MRVILKRRNIEFRKKTELADALKINIKWGGDENIRQGKIGRTFRDILIILDLHLMQMFILKN